MKENFWVDESLAQQFAAAVKALGTDKSSALRELMLIKIGEVKARYRDRFDQFLAQHMKEAAIKAGKVEVVARAKGNPTRAALPLLSERRERKSR